MRQLLHYSNGDIPLTGWDKTKAHVQHEQHVTRTAECCSNLVLVGLNAAKYTAVAYSAALLLLVL